MQPLLIKLLLVVLCSYPLLNVLQASMPQQAWAQPHINGIAARVEGRPITFEELRRRIAPLVEELMAQVPNPNNPPQEALKALEQMYQLELQRRIDAILIVNDFYDRQYQIPTTVVEAEFQRQLQEQFDGDQGKFNQYLAATGLSKEEYLREITENLIIMVMRRQVLQPLQVSPQKILQYNQRILLGIIRLPTELSVPEEATAREKAEAALAQLAAGVPFEEVAQTISPSSPSQATQSFFKWRKWGELRQEIRSVIAGLAIGEYSEPIPIENQLFILYVADKQAAELDSLQANLKEVEAAIRSEDAIALQERWLQELRQKAYIQYY